jgi:hypothetical protein
MGDSSIQETEEVQGQCLSEANKNPNVWLHLYNCDRFTGYLNKLMLDSRNIGIYHVGVEVYREEWAFQYYEDTWDDPSVSGLVRCNPRRMPEYDYRESVCLGPTPLSEDEVDQILLSLQHVYNSASYHLTKRNCITFAYDFVQHLQTPTPFPDRLSAVCEYASNSFGLDSAVEFGWSWAKWYMLRKHAPQEAGAEQNSYPSGGAGGPARQSSIWTVLSQSNACSGRLCIGATSGKVECIDDRYIREGYAKHEDQTPATGHVVRVSEFPVR